MPTMCQPLSASQALFAADNSPICRRADMSDESRSNDAFRFPLMHFKGRLYYDV